MQRIRMLTAEAVVGAMCLLAVMQLMCSLILLVLWVRLLISILSKLTQIQYQHFIIQ